MVENRYSHVRKQINRIAAAVLCLIILIAAAIPGSAFASSRENRTVKVGYVWSSNFSEGRSDDEYKSGYAYEYLQKVAYYTGWNYEYVYGDWTEIMKKLSSGEVDIMAGVSYTDERAEKMSFPDYPMGTENYYLYVWQNSEFANLKISELRNIKIGCTAGSMQNVYLEAWNREHGNCCSIKTFEGNEKLYKAFADHEVDAVADTDNAIVPSDGLVPVTMIGSSDYYLAVSKNRNDILGELNSALEEIDRVSPYYLQNLHNRYFSETAAIMTLSADEKRWIETHDKLTVGYLNNYLPCSDTDSETGKATGLVVDIFEEVFDKLSTEKRPEIKYVGFDSHNDMIDAVNEGKVDVVFPIYGDIWFSEMQGIFQTTDVEQINADLVYKGSYENLSIDKIAVNRNNLIQYEYTKRQYPDAEIVYFESIDECLKAVTDGKADCTITNGLRTDALTVKSDYASLDSIELTDSSSLCMGVKRGERALLTLLNHGLSTLDKNYVISNAHKYQNKIYVYTAKDFIRDNILWVLLLVVIIAAAFVYMILRYAKRTKKYLAQEKALTKSLETALASAQQANRAKTVFLNNMSHDIRTPMNAIVGFTTIAKKQNTNEEVEKCLDKIESSSEHLLTLINDVLDLSRVESGKVAYKPVPTNLCSVVDAVVSITQGFLTGRNLNFRIEQPEGEHPCSVMADSVRIREILVNILSNAVKFTDDGGSIVFSMGNRPGEDEAHVNVWFKISDTGCGMSEEFCTHIFDEFTQEESGARTQYKGTGLGMAIAKRYVDMMGGTISVKSQKGVGTAFTVELPFMLADMKTENNKSLAEKPVNLNGINVLLAEDNDLNAEIATVQLEELGMHITRAVDGNEAVRIFAERPAGSFDVILMDIMMPRLNGYQATQAIRGMNDRIDGRTVPIIAMTANAFAEDVAASLESGMNAHVAKPIAIDEVVRAIAINIHRV
ncbi:MAG: ATP-binding protein [Emergencia sp.]